jgi:hypothetical protein
VTPWITRLILVGHRGKGTHVNDDLIIADPRMAQALADNSADLMGTEGITGFDVGVDDSDELCLRVMVADPDDPPPGLPDSLDGFPVQVMRREPVLLGVPPDEATYPTVVGGIETGRSATGLLNGSGTLGCVLRDVRNGLAPVGVSAGHVLAGVDPYAVFYGDEIWQRNRPGNRVGSLLRWELPSLPPLSPDGFPSGFWDAAICTMERSANVGEIAEIGTATGIGSVRGILQPVRKRGCTTRLTYGVVRGMFGSYLFSHPGHATAWWLIGQIEIVPTDDPDLNPDGFAQPGDSGSVVVDEDGQIVGLLHAGGGGLGYATDFAPLSVALGVTL